MLSGLFEQGVTVATWSALVLATTGCVTGEAANRCSVEGARFLASNPDPATLCLRFEQRLDAALETAGSPLRADDHRVAITIGERGSLQALVSASRIDSAEAAYPVVAIDVMDRPIGERDLMQLADAVAIMISRAGDSGPIDARGSGGNER